MHMHPVILHDLAQARIADLHREARRDALAHAARRGRHPRVHQRSHSVRGLAALVARGVLNLLGASSP
jgi:hypothetical protein